MIHLKYSYCFILLLDLVEDADLCFLPFQKNCCNRATNHVIIRKRFGIKCPIDISMFITKLLQIFAEAIKIDSISESSGFYSNSFERVYHSKEICLLY